jgi:hypothetical protein
MIQEWTRVPVTPGVRYYEKGVAYGRSSVREGRTFSKELDHDHIASIAVYSLSGCALSRV